MKVEDRIKILHEVGEEIIGLDEIERKMKEGKKLIAYDGFEPSGQIHIAQGLMRAITVQKLIDAQIHFKFWVADWFAYANNKMGGDMEKIHKTGEYFIEVWKACGLNTDEVEFVWTSEAIKDPKYWERVLQIAKAATLKRVIRCAQIMGRSESDTLSAAQIMYPTMQAADIFYLNADIAQLGMDQRKVNVFARQIADELGWEKPAAIHHHMLLSLNPPLEEITKSETKRDITIALKMAKSKPQSAIFMTDTTEDIYSKIRKAYCPPKVVENNPILDYFKHIVFAKHDNIAIQREEKFGGNITFETYDALERSYVDGEIYPLDLKENLARYLDEMIEPVRKHFRDNKRAKELMEEVQSFAVTR
jgi:tyrosyl-tRNA synthetase